MAVSFTPLSSQSGFASPNFSVDSTGRLTLSADAVFNNNITVTGTIFANVISFGDETRNISIVDDVETQDGVTYELSDQITLSSLRRLGILDNLEVEGDVFFGRSSTTYFQLDDGTLRLFSLERGGIQNVDIGTDAPGDARFIHVDIGDTDSTGGRLNVIGNVNVESGDITLSGDLSVDGDITSTTLPTEIFHVTRKDYVDNRISAFSIAFGA